uniref:Sulfotransferase n=1 Tax=Sinocyclocheilus anshuiensis TaxID=1608454 RepID=A0A671SF31_9TELE
MFTYKGTVLTLENNHDLTPEYIDSLADFETKDDDVFVVTFPKSGKFPGQSQPNHTRVDALAIVSSNGEKLQHTSIFCSYLLQLLMPKMLGEKKEKCVCVHQSITNWLDVMQSFSDICPCCQVIYVMRNPKDVMVSYLHFSNDMKNLDSSESFDWMLENVFTGLIGGYWFDHVKGWITNKDKYNILILTYEEMIKDLRSIVVKICEFVGKNLSDAAIDKVVETATFKHMKKDPLANYESLSLKVTDHPKGFFFLSKCQTKVKNQEFVIYAVPNKASRYKDVKFKELFCSITFMII